MRNILAIASKELKSYFASPIGWILLGFWALLYGYFFVAILNFFVRQSMQMSQFGQAGPQAMNLNQQLLRPLVAQNLPILVLFLLPAVTMRTYSEERRSGTIELLLTSPLSDFQIIMGKFLGAMSLYVVMLGVTLIHIAILVVYGGRPEWKPIADHVPDQAIATRRRLLDRLAADHSKLIGFHLPYPGIGTVERKDNAYRFVPAA